MLARLAREALGVDRVLAHHGEMVKGAVRQGEAGNSGEHSEKQHAQPRPRTHSRDGIRGHQAEAHQQHPESGAGSDAHPLVAGGCERIAGGGRGERYDDHAQQRRAQPDAGVGHAEGGDCGEQQGCLTGKRSPRRQHFEEPARIARHDPVRLEDDEWQQDDHSCPGHREQRTEGVEPAQPRHRQRQVRAHLRKPCAFR